MTSDLKRYYMAVFGISNLHWIQAEKKRLASGEVLVSIH